MEIINVANLSCVLLQTAKVYLVAVFLLSLYILV